MKTVPRKTYKTTSFQLYQCGFVSAIISATSANRMYKHPRTQGEETQPTTKSYAYPRVCWIVFRIDDDESFEGDVAVTNGTLVVDGEVHGDLVAINADVELGRRAEIHGDVLVLGGSLRRGDGARVRGNTRLHRASVAVRRRGEDLDRFPHVDD